MSEPLRTSDAIDPFELGYALIRESCGLIELTQETSIVLSGEDRKGWLQGQVTNDLHHVHPGSSIAFCLCAPTGQLEAICSLWSFPDKFVLTTANGSAEAVLNRVRKMVIMEDVAAEKLTKTLISIQGPTATRELSKLMDLPQLDTGLTELEGQPIELLRSNRAGSGGWDLVIDPDHTKAIKKLKKTFGEIDPGAFAAAQLEAGIPVFGIDTDSKTLPPELGPAFEAQHISYKKGCYTGQEVLMRLHSRGHTNRTWMALASEEPLESGASISHASRPDAGWVTSACFSPEFGFIAGAMLRNEAAIPGDTVVVHQSGGDIEAQVYSMPLLRLL